MEATTTTTTSDDDDEGDWVLLWRLRRRRVIGFFKAFVLDAHNILPKTVPQNIQKIDIISGNGGPGTVYKVHFGAASHFKYMLHQTDAVDTQNLTYGYTVPEGDILRAVLEKITYDMKFEANQDGGSIVKNKFTYYTKGDIKINEDQLRIGKDKVAGSYKGVEAYLVANPDAYN
ncbi:hypothetical protein FNV43_RR27155 [Rhamnella rubrinervis]|uniref:Bet v I/Major latex protein domain-containing protein n=1 Tax=Rhamnella rubrinervis TaxID=2594499 RepID=A0A8K0GS98_9ROSA|nr:hypothetical protein FNV43_RR27155 [Rhamnella rubrinervis]